MGLLLNIDIDTHRGPSTKPYMRIDQITVQREANRMIVSTALYASKEDVELKQNVPGDAIFYTNRASNGEQVNIPLSFKFNLAQKVNKIVPVYEKQMVIEKVPYVSFDPETGDEITAYEEVKSELEDLKEKSKTEQKSALKDCEQNKEILQKKLLKVGVVAVVAGTILGKEFVEKVARLRITLVT